MYDSDLLVSQVIDGAVIAVFVMNFNRKSIHKFYEYGSTLMENSGRMQLNVKVKGWEVEHWYGESPVGLCSMAEATSVWASRDTYPQVLKMKTNGKGYSGSHNRYSASWPEPPESNLVWWESTTAGDFTGCDPQRTGLVPMQLVEIHKPIVYERNSIVVDDSDLNLLLTPATIEKLRCKSI